MSITEQAKLIGQTATLYSKDGFQINVTILDITQAYGNTRYKVTPVSGEGAVIVDSSRVKVGN